jgi:hypothetical protein
LTAVGSGCSLRRRNAFFKKIDFHHLLADFTFPLRDPIAIESGAAAHPCQQTSVRPVARHPLGSELMHASHLRHALSGVDLAHPSHL